MSTEKSELHITDIDADKKGLWIAASRQSSESANLREWVINALNNAANAQLTTAHGFVFTLNPDDFTLEKSGLSDAKSWWSDDKYDLFTSKDDELFVFYENGVRRVVYEALYYFDEHEHEQAREQEFIVRLYKND
jgi:hypothetical protein